MPESETVKRLKIWAGIISLVVTNVVTLVTAITAYNKPEKEETAKAAYSELSKAVENMSKDNVELHKDVSNIRGYLSGLAAQGAFKSEDADEADEPEPQPAAEPRVARRTNRTTNSRPISDRRIRLPKKGVQPPELKAKPAPYKPPSLGALKK